MRAKFIYEKFSEDSDPIKDMGIGMFKTKINFTDEEQFYEWLLYVIPLILNTDSIPDDILKTNNYSYIDDDIYQSIRRYMQTYNITFNNIPIDICGHIAYYWPKNLRNILLKKGFKK